MTPSTALNANPQTSAPSQDTAIRLRSISHRFGDVQALDGVTLDVPRGSIYGLLGPNGAGKTTTLRIILGLLRPGTGEVHTLGVDPRKNGAHARRRIGVLLEQDGHYEPMSVQENLEFYGRLHGLSTTRRRRRIRDVLDLFGLQATAAKPAGTLSKGMKRRLAVARTLLHEPELIILDEPTTGLDARAVSQLRNDLTQIVKEHGVTLIIATHNLTQAERMCDRVAVLDHGRLILEGPTHLIGMPHEDNQAILEAHKLPQKARVALRNTAGVQDVETLGKNPIRVRVRLDPGASAAPAVGNAIRAGAEIESVERPHASLEQTFLAATRTTTPPGPSNGDKEAP